MESGYLDEHQVEQLDKVLKGAKRLFPRVKDGFLPLAAKRFDYILSQWIGVEYRRNPLGEGQDSDFDNSPLADFQHVDCLTFIEQGLAMTFASNAEEVLHLLTKIRYRDGNISFHHRNHFFLADWITANRRIVIDVTNRVAETFTKRVKGTIDRMEFFRKKGFYQGNELFQHFPPGKETVVTTAIPPSALDNIKENLHIGDIIAIIAPSGWPVIVRHVGELTKNEKDEIFFRHASERAGKVIQESFEKYLLSFNIQPSFKVFRLTGEIP